MIPLVDDYLQLFISEKLRWLKYHPEVIDHIFRTGKRETLSKLRDFIENRKIKVTIGYPKDQNSLPCYVITLAPEQEQPIGLGDDRGFFEDYDLGIGDENNTEVVEEVEQKLTEFLADTYMNSNYRIECWSDNGDLTSYMYIILKWCLWSSRQQMLKLGWVNIRVSGTDLEPVPDYMPVFIYRRAAQINLMYENLYYEDIAGLEAYLKILEHPEDYHKDENGNIVDKDGNIAIPAEYAWIIRAHYYESNTDKEVLTKEYAHVFKSNTKLKTKVVEKLPESGEINTLYFLRQNNELTDETYYTIYRWSDSQFEPNGIVRTDLSEYIETLTV